MSKKRDEMAEEYATKISKTYLNGNFSTPLDECPIVDEDLKCGFVNGWEAAVIHDERVMALVEAVKLINENFWFDPDGSGACMFCEANLHKNAIGVHRQLNGEPCPVQVAHDALTKYREGIKK